jgi:nicotinate-nucleotide adenylyltransferase
LSKIGIFSGTFDPVHKGHITFALEALRQEGLASVYFLPEQTPRRKEGVTHYAHRVAMLKLALKPYKSLHVLELPDRQFDIAKSLPRLQAKFPDTELELLMGSDTFAGLVAYGWPNQEVLFERSGLLVGLRLGQVPADIIQATASLPASAKVGAVSTEHPHASSSDIRSAISRGKKHNSHLDSLGAYITEHWLYAVVSPNNS